MVSNPLVARRRMVTSGKTCDLAPTAFPEELLGQLVERIERSERQWLRFCYLVSDAIPKMELFRPGSEWVPPAAMPEAAEMDVEVIQDVVSRDMLLYVEVHRLRGKITGSSEVPGLWLLPAFAKHSCAPNCQHSLVGETLFYRASRHIEEGEELSIWYFTGGYEYVTHRRSSMRIGSSSANASGVCLKRNCFHGSGGFTKEWRTPKSGMFRNG